MIWQRDEDGWQVNEKVLSIILLLFFVALIFMRYEVAAALSVLFVFIGLQVLVFKKLGKGLTFHNQRIRKRNIKGSTSYWELTFSNNGFPIWNGQVTITFQDAVKPIDAEGQHFSEMYEVTAPLTIGRKERVTLRIPVVGSNRGLSRIKKLEVDIPHPFQETSLTLTLGERVQQEQIVYPSIHELSDFIRPTALKMGDFEYRHSLFNDVFLPIGTREYMPTDQFQHINWKASARMQSLQTKVFTQIANQSLLFVLNVAYKYSIISDFEEKINRLASYVEFCYKNGIPYSIAINLRSFGKSPYVYLPAGEGATQRQKALELLAVLSKNDLSMPFTTMLRHLQYHKGLPVTVIVLTHDVESYLPILESWKKETNVQLDMVEGRGELQWKRRSLKSS